MKQTLCSILCLDLYTFILVEGDWIGVQKIDDTSYGCLHRMMDETSRKMKM